MAGYGFKNNRGNFNTYKAMERHMHDANSTAGGARPSSSFAHSFPPAGESFLSMKKDNFVGGGEHPSNNIVEQDLFEKVRMQVTQLNRRRNWWVKPSTGNNNIHHQNNNNGEYDHKPISNGLQNGKYNFYAAAQGGAQRLRFGAPAADVSAK